MTPSPDPRETPERQEDRLRAALDDVAAWLELEATSSRQDPVPAMRQQARLVRDALDVAPHPGENHEFRTVCLRCGEYGRLHVALVTDLDVVKVEPRTAPEADHE